ncbi:MAG: TonB-dependent receptor [Gammaproteobacteria bacterium]|nr:MAG: TonB-dependent receptor [Gammaproteobacteria bacterium]
MPAVDTRTLRRSAPRRVTKSRPMLAAMALMAASAPAFAVEPTIEELVVLGTRGGERSVLDSVVPVDVFRSEALRSTYAAGNELGEALATLAPSFSFPRQSNSVTSDHLRAARLRNMGPDQVLVLVNGTRRHPSAVVNDNTTFGKGTNAFDFNSIPATAVKRVEILRDGASAQYGSDAIAGVINIVLEDASEGGQIEVGYGTHHTDFSPLNTTITDGGTFTLSGQNGITLGDDGFLRFGAEYRDRSITNRAGVNRVPAFVAPQTADNLAFAGQRSNRSGDPAVEEFKLWFNSERAVGPGELYAFGTLASSDTRGAVLFRHPDSNQNVRELFPDGTQPETTGENLDFAVTGGGRLLVDAWNVDSSISFGRNEFDFGVRNSLNPSLGPDSPTHFHSGTFRFDQVEVEVDGLRQLEIARQTIILATGVAWRYERFRSTPGDPASFEAGDFRFDRDVTLADGTTIDFETLVGGPDIGAQGAKGLTPADAARRSRHVGSAYVDLSSQLTDRLFASVAGRYEYYDDFGSTWSGKLAGRYDVSRQVSLRGSVSNSFRAPTLSQIAWSRSDNTFDRETFERISSRLVRADSAIGEALGLTNLEEETSRNYSLGAALRITPELSLTVDAFRIDVDDRITVSESLQSPALIDLVQDLPGGAGVRSVNFFTNAIDTRTEGVEVAANWITSVAGGNLAVNAAYTYATTEIRRVDTPSETLLAIDPGLNLIESGARNVLTNASPKHNAVLSATWEQSGWQLVTRSRHFSSVVRDRGFARQRFGSETLFDVAASYSMESGLGLTLGADNVIDATSDRSSENLDFGGNFAFDVLSPAGADGRFVYGQLSYRF